MTSIWDLKWKFPSQLPARESSVCSHVWQIDHTTMGKAAGDRRPKRASSGPWLLGFGEALQVAGQGKSPIRSGGGWGTTILNDGRHPVAPRRSEESQVR